MIFERKIMRKIFGPTRTDDGYWRIKTNQEISDILKEQNIIGFIKKTDGILEDIKSINIRNWKKVAQNRDSWKKVVEQARTLHRL